MVTYRRRKLLLSLSLGLLIVLLTVILGVSAQEGMGGKLVVADASANVPLDPFVTSWHVAPHYALYSTLFQKDLELNYVGYLADTWEASEDGSELTINLIDYAMFSDGTSVNAEALKWNIMKYADPEATASQGADLRGLVTDVRVDDEFTFTIVMTSSYAPLYNTLAGLEIVSPTAYEAEGADGFEANPVGAGPYLLNERTSTYVSFVRNPDFTWLPEEIYANTGPVNLDEFEVRFIGEEQTILAAFDTGELQIVGIPPQNLAEEENNPDITLTTQMEAGIRYFGFNTSKAPWDNVELRQAFNYAINRDEFVQLAWDGRCEPLYQPLPPTIWGHNPELDATSYQFNQDKANELLDGQGYLDVNGDGIRETPEGTEWVVPMAVSSESDEWRRQAEVIESQLRDVGIPIRIDLMERQALIDLTTTGTHDLFLLQYGQTEPSILTYFFDPQRRGGSNRAWFVDDTLTALLKQADTDLNRETRYETIQQISRIVIDQSPWVFLCVPVLTTGVRNELQDWILHPQDGILTWNAYIGG